MITQTKRHLLRTAAVATVAVAMASVVMWDEAARSDETGYTFSNVRVFQVDPSHARVVYDYAWATDEFPGWRTCTWTVYGPDGGAIGATTNDLMGLDDQYVDKEKLVNVSGVPTSADVSCEPGRLDSSSGYTIEEVRATRRGNDPRGVTVMFAATWAGSGRPGAVSCTAVVKDQEGDVLTTQDFDFAMVARENRGLTHSWLTPEPLDERPATADLRCAPFGSS